MPGRSNGAFGHSDNDSENENLVKTFSVVMGFRKSEGNNRQEECSFCDRIGHKEPNCFLNPDNQNNRLSAKLEQCILSGKAAIENAAQRNAMDANVEFVGVALSPTHSSVPASKRDSSVITAASQK